MKQLLIKDFFKPVKVKKLRPLKVKKLSPKKEWTQKLITDYWDEFTRIPTMSFFELFTFGQYKSGEEFVRNFRRKNWR